MLVQPRIVKNPPRTASPVTEPEGGFQWTSDTAIVHKQRANPRKRSGRNSGGPPAVLEVMRRGVPLPLIQGYLLAGIEVRRALGLGLNEC